MYDKGSCELSYKPFYHPIEAVIRWCGLQNYETQILHAYHRAPHTLSSALPQWPCLYLNLEKLFDAVANRDLPYGSLGVTVTQDIQVAPECLTLRHNDLKYWMTRYYPDQRPPFLFDEFERVTHTAISTDAFHVLQAEGNALRIQVYELQVALQNVQEQFAAVVAERNHLLQTSDDELPLSERSLRGYECVLGAILKVILGRSPAGNRHSVFDSQEALVTAIIAHCGEQFGISKRSLDTKFAAARRRLKDS